MALFFYKEKNKDIRAAAYLRLSIEDGDKAESNSIGNQRELIRDFAAERPGLHLVEEYADDGYTGTNFKRPAFTRLMNDVRQKKIKCIVVKDLSRFGRNYLEAGYYIETVFPFLGVRLIAVADNFDSNRKEDMESLALPIRNMVNVFASTKPIIGNFLTAETDKDHSFQILKDYTFIRYSAALALLVPSFVLCDCFISAWLGSGYILPTVISLLLVSDIFIHFVHGALVDYIAGLGYFKADRSISIVGAIINLTVSFILVQYIGLTGVLVGTVISQAYFWINRSLCVFNDYFQDKRKLLKYWALCICYILVFYILCILCHTLFQFLPLDDSYIKFIVGGIGCYLIILPVYLICFARNGEFKYLCHMIQKQTGRLIK